MGDVLISIEYLQEIIGISDKELKRAKEVKYAQIQSIVDDQCETRS